MCYAQVTDGCCDNIVKCPYLHATWVQDADLRVNKYDEDEHYDGPAFQGIMNWNNSPNSLMRPNITEHTVQARPANWGTKRGVPKGSPARRVRPRQEEDAPAAGGADAHDTIQEPVEEPFDSEEPVPAEPAQAIIGALSGQVEPLPEEQAMEDDGAAAPMPTLLPRTGPMDDLEGDSSPALTPRDVNSWD